MPIHAVCRNATAALLLYAAPLHAQTPTHADSGGRIGLKQVAIGFAVLGAAIATDAPVARHYDYTASAGTLNTARQLDRFGDASGIAVVVGGLAAASLVTRDPRVFRTTKRTVAALIIASTFTQATKYIVGRSRPDDDPDRDGFDFHNFHGSPAFPSGHTTVAFTLATTLGDAVGKTWARVGLYTLATGTGWARLQEQVHWVSDIVAGAAVGFAAAKFAEGKFRVFGVQAPEFLITPKGPSLTWSLPPIR